MAHGFLTPQPVSGDNFWRNAKDLYNLAKRIRELLKKTEKEVQKGGGLATTQKGGIIDESVKAVRVTDVGSSKPEAPVRRMLQKSAFAGALGAGTDSIVKKQQLALPPGGPKLPPGASPSGKGGTFTNLPGISAAPKKLDADAFFKAAQTGVHPETGQYLSSEERKNYLQKSKSKLNATASVASAASPGISSVSNITKGDEAIVGSVDNLSSIVTSLVDAVKSQTAAQKQISEKEQQKADTLSSRALAKAEEKSMAGAMDNSGTLTPVGGLGGAKLGGGATQGGMGGPGFGLGGKAIANAVGKRGIGRMATRAGAHFAGKQGAKMGAKVAGKLGLKAAGVVGKKIPLLGLGLGGLFAVQRAMKGDWAGAGMELASGAASTLPGIGTAASVGLDAALMAKDAASGNFAGGGLVTGGKKSVVDDVKINADEGEVVMSNAAGNAFGRSNLMAINAMAGGTNKPTGGKSFAGGGLVGGDAAKSKKMFTMFGEGMLEAQKKNKREYANIQASGLKQYYENQGGIKSFAKGLVEVFKGLGTALSTLFGGNANAATNPNGAADQLAGGDFSGSSGQDQAMNYFMSQGLSKDQAAGIVGNLMQESTAAIDPKAKNGSGHRGIAQWDANRWGNFEKWAKTKGLDVNTREAQLQWIMEEMKTGSGGLSLKTLKGAKTSRQAGQMFLEKFERSGEKAGSAGFENRMKNAATLASRDISGGGGSGSGKIIEYLTGDKSSSGYRADHGGGNYHEHLAFATTQDRDRAMAALRANGIKIGSINSGTHSKGSYHYKNLAFDVPAGGNVPVGQEQSLSAKVRSILSRAGFSGKGIRASTPIAQGAGGGGEKPGSERNANAAAPARTKADLVGSGRNRSPAPRAASASRNTGSDIAQASAFYTTGMRNSSGGGNNTTIINNNSDGGSNRGTPYPSSSSTGSQGMGLTALQLRIQ